MFSLSCGCQPSTLRVRGSRVGFSDPDYLWAGQNLNDHYPQAHTPWEWLRPIMERAHELGLSCFSSPVEEHAVVCLEDLASPPLTIASFETNHLPLIEKAVSTGNPLIISAVMASFG